MITFRQIRRRDFFSFFVSILRVIKLCMHSCYENSHNIACPKNGKTFKFKIGKSQKGTCAYTIMQFWAGLCPDFGKSFFPKTRMPQKGTYLRPPLAPVAPPENGKTFILETRMPQKGTYLRPHWRRLHPLKTAKHLFWKQECPKKGLS